MNNDALSFAVLTDIHYAERDMAINRYYRDSAAKVRLAAESLNERNPAFTVLLGDMIDGGETPEQDMTCLRNIETECERLSGDRHYVVGNHDVAGLSKAQFFDHCAAHAPYYSFDTGDFHSIILDACYRTDGVEYDAGNFEWTDTFIPSSQCEWLKADLAATMKKTVVFVHQRLDDERDPHGVRNAPAVRELLEASEKVLAVFQGHDHRGNYRRIGGIHYVTFRALVDGAGLESNAYALVTVRLDSSLNVEGFGRQPSLEV